METLKPDQIRFGVPHGAGLPCFECARGEYIPCARPTCNVCGAEAPTTVRQCIRELDAARPAA